MDAFCPSLEFEKAAGITGIGRRYKTTDPRSLEEIYEEYNDNAWRALTEMEDWHPDVKQKYEAGLIGGPLDKTVFRQYQKALYDDLLALNPELAKIRYRHKHEGDIGHIVSGALSGFSPVDIDYFLNRPFALMGPVSMRAYFATGKWPSEEKAADMAPAIYTIQHYTYCDALENKSEASLQWVPAPATIKLIKQKLGFEDWEPSAAEWKKSLKHRWPEWTDKTGAPLHPILTPQSLKQLEQSVADIRNKLLLFFARPFGVKSDSAPPAPEI